MRNNTLKVDIPIASRTPQLDENKPPGSRKSLAVKHTRPGHIRRRIKLDSHHAILVFQEKARMWFQHFPRRGSRRWRVGVDKTGISMGSMIRMSPKGTASSTLQECRLGHAHLILVVARIVIGI